MGVFRVRGSGVLKKSKKPQARSNVAPITGSCNNRLTFILFLKRLLRDRLENAAYHRGRAAAYFSSAFFSSFGAGKSSVLVERFQRRTPALWVPMARREASGEKATHQQVLVC